MSDGHVVEAVVAYPMVFFAIWWAWMNLTWFASAYRRRGVPAERYGLFTIIVLGESVLSATAGVQSALEAGGAVRPLVTTVVGGLLVVFAMWWLDFDQPAAAVLVAARESTATATRGALVWGYGHFVVFATVAATGAGLAVAIDHVSGEGVLTGVQAGLATNVPLALYLVMLSVLHLPGHPLTGPRRALPPLTSALVLGSSWLPEPLLTAGVVLVVAIVIGTVTAHDRRGAPASPRVRRHVVGSAG